MIGIVEYFEQITGFKAIKQQKELLLALTNDEIKKLIVTAGRGFSKSLCTSIAILWYSEKAIQKDKPIKLMIVSPQDTMFQYVEKYFGKSEALMKHRLKRGVYTEVPIEGFQLLRYPETDSKEVLVDVFTKPATNKVRGNRANILFLDETADINEAIIKSAMGCLTGKLNRLVLISTCHKSGYFTTRAMNPKKYDYTVLQFNAEKCPWLKQTVSRAKVELTKAEYAMEVLGRAPTKEERGTYPHKNIQKCIVDDVVSEGGMIEAGLDFAYSPCKTVLYLTERNGIRRKDIFHKSWSKKPIETIAPEIAEILEKHNAVIVKADAHPREYKGHVEKHTKTPIFYIEFNMTKEAMIGQFKRRLLQKQIEIQQKSVDTIKQLRYHRRNLRTGDDIHDALILSCYEPKIPFNVKPRPCIYINGKPIT